MTEKGRANLMATRINPDVLAEKGCKRPISMATWWCSILLLFGTTAHAQPSTIVAERIAEISWAVSVRSASHQPDETDLLLVGHDGVVHYWQGETGTLRAVPFMDLGENGLNIVDFGIMSEQGVNDMTLDPEFGTNGLVYIIYNGYRPDGTGNLIDQRLICFGTSSDHSVVDPDSWYEVVEWEQPDRGHNGGQIHFGSDSLLYISTGDGGSTGTGEPGGNSNGDDHGPIGNAQSMETLLGKMLRIRTHGQAPYTIPSDNPFVDVADARDEIWAYGFRNPWRWSFDRLTGDKFISDVGEVDWEELSFEPADSEGGLNFGWRLKEGNHCYNPLTDCDPDAATTPPIFDYPHTPEWCSVIGGYRYRGEDIPTLYGHYILSDACGFGPVRFWSLTEQADESWASAPLEIKVPGDFVPWTETRFAFGEDNRGELYLCTRLAVYHLLYDGDDVPDGSEVGTNLIFSRNPVAIGDDVTLDLGANLPIERLRITDASGRLIHDVMLSTASSPYVWNTAGMAPGSYIIEAWTLTGNRRWGRLAVVRI